MLRKVPFLYQVLPVVQVFGVGAGVVSGRSVYDRDHGGLLLSGI